jgi:3-oxo-5alpha-steroid 4-dehydrogenase
VILSSGGFIYNREMLKEHAPRYLAGVPLGSQGDDGSGIQLGRHAGGATDMMHNVSFWRFINPPEAFPKGILVNRKGKRICNEQYYGAKTGELMCNEENATQGILIIDTKLWREAHRGLLPDRAKWFQSMLTVLYLYTGKRAGSVGQLGKCFGIPVDTLMETIEEYNALARKNGEGDPMGKMPAFFHELKPPFVGINVSLDSFAGATLTLGGLVVNEESGEVKREDGSEIHGLYAAGRTAVGVSSSGYVSGLSIADCVFSGRRAANHASNKRLVETLSE